MMYVKKYGLLVGLVAFLSLLVLHVDYLWAGVTTLFSVSSSLIYGGILAFILNVPMKKIEDLLTKWRVRDKFRRPLAISGVIIGLTLVAMVTLGIVLPTLTQTINQLGQSLSTTLEMLREWLEQSNWLTDETFAELAQELQNKSGELSKALVIFLGSLTSNVGHLFTGLISVFITTIFMFSFLSSKEYLSHITVRLLRSVLPQKLVNKLCYIGGVAAETYDQFLISQLVEAAIIGILVFLGYSLFGLPYAGMTGVLAGVLSFIPYIGPFLACGLGAVFIFTVSPSQALLSLILFQVIQLIEGNVIYPKVVGRSIGLPALFTLAAASIGGNLFGLLGMIFFTPIFAVVYSLVKEFVLSRETKSSF